MDVELGFVKKSSSWKLRSKFFPSKIGGKPSWLTLDKLPSELICKTCCNPLVFLLQVYANLDERDDTFHRSIYLFMCSNGKCIKRFSNDNFIVFRTQLPRKNRFYSHEPPIMEEKTSSLPSAEQFQNICDICGCKALFTCEKCSERYYCSDYHKEGDWNFNHKKHCGADIGTKKKKTPANPFLLPEFEIESDVEYLPTEKPEKSDDEKMKEYQQFMKSDKAPKDFQDTSLDDLDSVMKKNDKAFNKFRKRIEHNPEQVLRYQRNGEPLLVSFEHVPTEADIPHCKCGAKRIFEFQVMSQILLYLSLDSVEESPDWGTLLIYTCSKSCEAGTDAYIQEFLWKQDFSDS